MLSRAAIQKEETKATCTIATNNSLSGEPRIGIEKRADGQETYW
jgi:hypothetical protein